MPKASLWPISDSIPEQSFGLETYFIKQGYQNIVGLDEAGRGCLAGPVVAAACVFLEEDPSLIAQIKDSKKMSAKKREHVFEALKNSQAVQYAVASVDAPEIDQINILQASLKAMHLATIDLEKKLNQKIDLCLIDGNQSIQNLHTEQYSLIKGDDRCVSIAAASILAKVSRDTMMKSYAKSHPNYDLEQHKGYPTKTHKQKIAEHGLSPIHRKSFKCGF